MENCTLRPARESDLPQLLTLEETCFETDRLSRRSFLHWFKTTRRLFVVAERESELLGYGLVILYNGTRLARLYSIAVRTDIRRKGIGRALLVHLEELAAAKGRLAMRLEVNRINHPAIALYESSGYRIFGLYHDYYENHNDALRMQKRIRFPAAGFANTPVPWYRQTTQFTCGAAAMMMAMAGLDRTLKLTQDMELDIWRGATTIFMTSGHGGSHPLGLALEAHRRGFHVEVFMNRRDVLFVEGVRTAHKKEIMAVVEDQFRRKAADAGIPVHYEDVTVRLIETWLKQGLAVLVLVSTYRMNGDKTPHWVTVTAIDDQCLYVHDSDAEDDQGELDCRDIPIARADFAKMSVYGSRRLRVAVVLGNPS
ncbi:MAG: GNAT family N-acetyltransferase/peptidase C39 family protein [Kiritimatiellales bacterium]|nr:GNAT family N-acetyltransferase/peptidase C39 family protein [Kiritimatiellales bacterium]